MAKRENILEMVASIDAKRRKQVITQTQSSLNYNVSLELTAPGIPRVPVGMTYEERIRLSAMPVGFTEVEFGDKDAPLRQSPVRVMSAGLSMMKADSIMMDARQMSANDMTETKIVSILDQGQAEHDEAVCEDTEVKLRTAGSPSGENKPKLNGLWEHMRGTHNSGGTVVAQPTPAFNGIYAVKSDATVSATYQNLSRVTYPRLTNLNATYDDSQDTMDLARVIKRMGAKSSFKPSPIMRFKQTIGDCVVLCPHNWYLSYSEIINTKNADKNQATDTEPQDATHIGRMRLVACPSLDSDSLVPFFGLRLTQYKWLYDPKWWMKRSGPYPIADERHGMFWGWDWIAQLWCSNPRNAGFVYHRATAAS